MHSKSVSCFSKKIFFNKFIKIKKPINTHFIKQNIIDHQARSTKYFTSLNFKCYDGAEFKVKKNKLENSLKKLKKK